MTISISDFKANFEAGARPNLFRVRIAELGAKVEFMCKASNLPGATIGMVEVPFMGRVLKVPGNRTFTEWTVTIINDNDFSVRKNMEDWMNRINGHETNLGDANIATLFRDGIVEQLGRDGEVLYTYEFKDLWPTELGEIALAMDSNDEIEEFECTFAYNYWSSAVTT